MVEVEEILIEDQTKQRSKNVNGKSKVKRIWKDSDIENLINHYKCRPNLWDTFNLDYHNREKRSKDIEEIVQTMPIPKAQFSRKVHMESKIKSGEATEERYTSKM